MRTEGSHYHFPTQLILTPKLSANNTGDSYGQRRETSTRSRDFAAISTHEQRCLSRCLHTFRLGTHSGRGPAAFLPEQLAPFPQLSPFATSGPAIDLPWDWSSCPPEIIKISCSYWRHCLRYLDGRNRTVRQGLLGTGESIRNLTGDKD